MNVRQWWDTHPRAGWWALAQCRDQGRDWAAVPTRSAQRICAQCPVADDCLVAALRGEWCGVSSRWGVYGGMGPQARQQFAQVLAGHGIVCGPATSTAA